MFQFGAAPEKKLSPERRDEIAAILGKPAPELASMFDAVNGIITRFSPEAQPLLDRGKRDRARAELCEMRNLADELQSALGKIDREILLPRLVLASLLTGPSGEAPLGDFSLQLLRFRNLLQAIDEGLTPNKGGKDQTDHLRSIALLCAIEYEKAVGQKPAKWSEGPFRQMMDVVLAQIDLSLPMKPDNILGPAIDAAFRSGSDTGDDLSPKSAL